VRQFEQIVERSSAAAPRPRPAAGFVTEKNAVATTAQSKALVYERLRWLMDRGQLVLPREADLLRELAALRLELRPGGGESIAAGVGHDDLPDSLYIATGPRRKKGAGYRCVLADLAALRAREVDVPELHEPVVTTGAGLRLYKRPPLQSVAGDELTLPEHVQVRDHAAEQRRSFGEQTREALRHLREKEALNAR
jgi:hypothetical protein